MTPLTSPHRLALLSMIHRGEQTPADAAIVSLMSKRMADIQRIHNLEDQLREAEARARENQKKLRQRDMNELIKQAEVDYYQLWSQMKR